MANGYDSSSMYDVSEPRGVTGYLGAGDAVSQTLQREMLRRAQFQQQAQEQARQAVLDQQANELRQAQLANTQESTASLVQQRQAQADLARQNTTDKERADYRAQYGRGADITNDPAAQATANRLGLRIINTAAVPGTAAVTGQMDPDSGLPAADMQAAPGQAASVTVAGTVKEEQQAKIDAAIADFEASGIDMTDKPAVIAAMTRMHIPLNQVAAFLKPEKTSAEKTNEFDTRMQEVGAQKRMAAQGLAEMPSKKELAEYDEWSTRKPTSAQKAAITVDVHNQNANADAARPEKPAAVQKYRGSNEKQMNVDEIKATEHGAEADHLLNSLHGENGITDEAAVNQFLSMTSAGQGKGFRMTTAERDAIKHARSILGNWQAFANKIIGGQQLIPAQRAAMEEVARAYKAEADRIHGDYKTARASMKGVTSSQEVNDIVSHLRDTLNTSPEDQAKERAAEAAAATGGKDASYYLNYAGVPARKP